MSGVNLGREQGFAAARRIRRGNYAKTSFQENGQRGTEA